MVITVTCPSCSSAFPVDPAKIPEGGVNARCTSCGDIFRIEKPAEPEVPTTLEEAAEPVAEAAAPVSSQVTEARAPITASEDFAQFLAHVPGAFAFIGNGETSAPLHNPDYDFNDAALLHGAQVYAAIARHRLPET